MLYAVFIGNQHFINYYKIILIISLKKFAVSNKCIIFVSTKRNNMNTYSEYKDLQGKQNTIVDMLSDKLNSYPKGDFGMVEESVRLSDEFRLVKSNFNKEFKKLQEINRLGMKMFKKEIRKSHEEKRIRK